MALVVVVVGSSFAGDDTPPGDEIAETFFRFEGSLTYDDEGYAALLECPLGDPRVLARTVADVVDVDAAVLGGEAFVDAYDRSREYPAITQCFVSSDPADGNGPTTVGFSVSEVPRGSYRDFLLASAYDDDVEVTVDVQRRWDGEGPSGDVFGYCYRAIDLNGCGADVVDRMNGVIFSVYLQGDSRRAEEAVEAVRSVIGDMIDNLGKFVEDNPVPSTTSNGVI